MTRVERREQLYRRVEFVVGPAPEDVLTAIQTARDELRDLGFEQLDHHVTYDATARRYVVAVDVPVESYDLIEPPDDFLGIVAFLPRDWPRLIDSDVHNVALPTLTKRAEAVKRRIDDWVYEAVSRD